MLMPSQTQFDVESNTPVTPADFESVRVEARPRYSAGYVIGSILAGGLGLIIGGFLGLLFALFSGAIDIGC